MLGEWAAFERSFGPILVHERIDAAGATICAVLANLLSSGKRYSPADFLPNWSGERAKEQSPEEMTAFIEALARGQQGRRRKRRTSAS